MKALPLLEGFFCKWSLMTLLQNIFYAYVIAINCFAYALMWYDKHQSKKKGNRIPENKLFLVAFVFGALGIYLGMKAPIYHKSAKTKFKWGIPLLFVINVIGIYICSRFRSN
jgi:uncharacterized membrane protein YsdA (DUF1294 family)